MNITTLLEHPKWFEPHLSVGKKKDTFKYEMVGDMDTSYHGGNLREPQDDFLKVHAFTHVEEMWKDVQKTLTFNTPLDLSYEDDNTKWEESFKSCQNM